MILGAIVVAEIAFWAFLVGGLAVRYVLRAPRVGAALLIATPLIDLVLLILTYIDLSSGNDSSFVHGLSALYIGFSLVFGPSAVKAMDARFARRYQDAAAGGTSTTGPAGQAAPDSLEAQQRNWLRCCLASGISVALLGAGIAVVGFAGSFWLLYWIVVVVSVVVVWWIIGPGLTRWRARRGPDAHVGPDASAGSDSHVGSDAHAGSDAHVGPDASAGPNSSSRSEGTDRAPH